MRSRISIIGRVPYLWHENIVTGGDGKMLQLPMPFNTLQCEVLSMNKDGLMAGYAYGNDGSATGVLWQNGQRFNMTYRLNPAAVTAGWSVQKLWDINDNGVMVASAYRSGFNGLVLLIPDPAVQLITPSGDPINAPVDNPPASCGSATPAPVDGQNEFTFDGCNPGILRVHLKAKVQETGTAGALASRCRFTIDAIGDSTMSWNSNNPGGQPTANGDYLEADVTFTGLPSSNSGFGRKNVMITVDGTVRDQKAMEVFFPRGANNHPGSAVPNWFHYWTQLTSISGIEYGGAGSGQAAEVKGITNWNYTVPISKTAITVYDRVITRFQSYEVGEEFSGIDQFFGTVIHEAKHVDQIARADALLPTTGFDSFRYGWSWREPTHNHWKKGLDTQWGVASLDDDGNATVDDAAPLPPFEPGSGDDENLDHPTFFWWPNSWPLPNPQHPDVHPIESEAINSSDNAHNENQRARDDWGDPGKNHRTLNEWDD